MLLSTVLKGYGLDSKRTILVRHAVSNDKVKTCIKKGFLDAYQAIQPEAVFSKYTHVMVFLGEKTGTTAVFYGLYEVTGELFGGPFISKMPEGYPYPEEYVNDKHLYNLVKDESVSAQLEGMVIEWGRGTRAWHQVATKEKEVIVRRKQ